MIILILLALAVFVLYSVVIFRPKNFPPGKSNIACVRILHHYCGNENFIHVTNLFVFRAIKQIFVWETEENIFKSKTEDYRTFH
jgi:hypothetical protein